MVRRSMFPHFIKCMHKYINYVCINKLRTPFLGGFLTCRLVCPALVQKISGHFTCSLTVMLFEILSGSIWQCRNKFPLNLSVFPSHFATTTQHNVRQSPKDVLGTSCYRSGCSDGLNVLIYNKTSPRRLWDFAGHCAVWAIVTRVFTTLMDLK